MRIELTTTAWKAVVLPLNYTRVMSSFVKKTVRTGFEPAISCVTGKHVNPYTTGPIAEVGLEPTTFGLWARRDANFSTPRLLKWLRTLSKEDKGFEPLRAFTRLTVFKTVPFSRTWVILRNKLILKYVINNDNDPYGTRTRVTAVKGRCLNRLTNGPL